MTTHLLIGLRTPDEFGIFFTRTYGNGEAADDVAYGQMGAPAAFESFCRPPLIASSPQASRDHGTAAPSGQYRLIQFAIRLSVRFYHPKTARSLEEKAFPSDSKDFRG
jgi:hypothetical protein